jgi:branched-chain amino acid transport system ATP-binding protein
MAAFLEAKGVTKRFGGLVAVGDLDFEMELGAIASVIGPNGAGKTTFFNCISGFFHIDEGQIVFDGSPIHRLRPDQVSHLGISRTYQNTRLFPTMTALENILVGEHQHPAIDLAGRGHPHPAATRRGDPRHRRGASAAQLRGPARPG